MPIPLALLLAAGGGAAVGGIAGWLKDKSKTEQGIDLGAANVNEQAGSNWMYQGGQQFADMVQAGPGQQDVTNGYNAQTGLAALLKQMSMQGGTDPTQQDIDGSNSLASKLFQAQRTQLGQNFEDQSTSANRQAALMGRSMNDPVLRAKLAQEQTRQSSMLDAQQGSWATQRAMNNPYERLNLTGQRANVLGGLATQAMANRQALASMGEGIMNTERQFRLNTGTKWGNQESGGGMKGALTGMLAGAGTGAAVGGMFGGFGGGFGGASNGASPFSGYNYGGPANQTFGVSSGANLMSLYGK